MPKPRNKKRNRADGHHWELEVVKGLRENGYPFAVTARSENRSRDAQKIDIVNKDEAVNGRMQDDIQAKSTTTGIPWKLLLEMEKNDKGKVKRRKILAVKIGTMVVDKTDTKRRTTSAKLAVMHWRDYLQLLKAAKSVQANDT